MGKIVEEPLSWVASKSSTTCALLQQCLPLTGNTSDAVLFDDILERDRIWRGYRFESRGQRIPKATHSLNGDLSRWQTRMLGAIPRRPGSEFPHRGVRTFPHEIALTPGSRKSFRANTNGMSLAITLSKINLAGTATGCFSLVLEFPLGKKMFESAPKKGPKALRR